MANTTRQRGSVGDKVTDMDASVDGFVGYWYAKFSMFCFIYSKETNASIHKAMSSKGPSPLLLKY